MKKTQIELKPPVRAYITIQFPLTAVANEGGHIRQGKEKKPLIPKTYFPHEETFIQKALKEHLDTSDKALRNSTGIREDENGQVQTLNKSDTT